MKKKILLALSLIAILTVFFAISVSAAEPVKTWNISATENDNVTAYLYEDTVYYTLTISGKGNMKDFSWDGAPWYGLPQSVVIEKGVTNIGSFAFLDCDRIYNVTIGENVKTIGDSSFYNCFNMNSIELPDSVVSIGDNAFAYCDWLREITFGKNVESIGDNAFEKCLFLESVVLPDSVKNIGMSAFIFCESLSNVWIGEGVTIIEDNAFRYCYNLEKIHLGQNVKEIKQGAFHQCNELEIEMPKNLKYIGDSAFYQCQISHPLKLENVSEIGDYAFTMSSVTEVVFGNNVTYIGEGAFEYCYFLEKVTMGNSVEDIGERAFYCCDLKSIAISQSVISVGSDVFAGNVSLIIYCEAESKPSGWHDEWNSDNCPVVWGYFDENACLEDIFTFKGYSFGFAGQISFGFDIDYEAKALYEEKTGKTLEMGVLFAGYDNLGGKQPLDKNGNAIDLDVGRVIKADLTNFKFPYYDFVLFDIGDSIKDVKLVISAYLYDGETVKYVQENGISNTVTGISYNEAKESVAQ